MDKDEIKSRIDFDNIQEYVTLNVIKEEERSDYLVDYDGNFIVPLSPLEVKLIEKIKDLELRIKKLEEVKE